MLGTTAFQTACIQDNPKFRIRLFINFTGSHDTIGGPHWTPNDQTPDTTHFPDIADFILGQFKISYTELEGILQKTVSRKTNFTLKNKARMFDYKVFWGSYDPSNNHYNGPYDTDIFNDTGKKIGNIRSGRLVIVQVGVYDTVSTSWIYIDKFRGRLADWSVSQIDQNVQVTVEDETLWYQQVESSPDVYLSQKFEDIFIDQCVNRLGFDPADVICSTTLFVFPFVHIPDLSDKVFEALTKLSEVVGGKVYIDEVGKIHCFSRLYEGDDPYSFPGAEDAYRTFTADDVAGISDILSTTRLFNQALINQVEIKSSPLAAEGKITKIWKFKVFYNEDNARNEGFLKPDRYFGDVWAYNTNGSTEGGPVKAIDRDSLFNTGGQDQHNKSYELKMVSVPSGGSVNVTITDLDDGVPYGGTMTCDGITETHLGTIHTNLANVYVILEPEAQIVINDTAELQIGIVYYAEFGNFKVYPNQPGATPATSQLKFEIISAINDPGGPDDWTDELTAKTEDNNHSDRVVMVLQEGESDYNLGNVFFKSSFDGDAWNQVKILIVNRDSQPRYVKALEIFGRRIVESRNLKCTVRAKQSIIDAFGGVQTQTLTNNLIPHLSHAEMLGRFITDNYSVPRDIPKVDTKRARPFFQTGDRIKLTDVYTTLEKEYILRNIEETFSIESVSQVFDLREADTGVYDVTGSQSTIDVQSAEPLITLGASVDVGAGEIDPQQASTADFTWLFDHEPSGAGLLNLVLTSTQSLKDTPILTSKYINGDIIAASSLTPIGTNMQQWGVAFTIDGLPAHTGLATFEATGTTVWNTDAYGLRKYEIDNTPPAVPLDFSFFVDSTLDFWLTWANQAETDLSGFYLQCDTVGTFNSGNLKTFILGTVFDVNLKRALKDAGVWFNFENGIIYCRIRSFDDVNNQSSWTSTLEVDYALIFANFVAAQTHAGQDLQLLLDQNFFSNNAEFSTLKVGELAYTLLNVDFEDLGWEVGPGTRRIKYTTGQLILLQDETEYWNIYGNPDTTPPYDPSAYDLHLLPGIWWLYARCEHDGGGAPVPSSSNNQIMAYSSRRTGPTMYDDGTYYYRSIGLINVSATPATDAVIATSYGYTYLNGNHLVTGTIDANKVNVVSATGSVLIGGDGVEVFTGFPGTLVTKIGWLPNAFGPGNSTKGLWSNNGFFGGAGITNWKILLDTDGFLIRDVSGGRRPPIGWTNCQNTSLTDDNSEICLNKLTSKISIYDAGAPEDLLLRLGDIAGLSGGKMQNGSWDVDVPAGTKGLWMKGFPYFLSPTCDQWLTPTGGLMWDALNDYIKRLILIKPAADYAKFCPTATDWNVVIPSIAVPTKHLYSINDPDNAVDNDDVTGFHTGNDYTFTSGGVFDVSDQRDGDGPHALGYNCWLIEVDLQAEMRDLFQIKTYWLNVAVTFDASFVKFSVWGRGEFETTFTKITTVADYWSGPGVYNWTNILEGDIFKTKFRWFRILIEDVYVVQTYPNDLVHWHFDNYLLTLELWFKSPTVI